MICGYIRWKKYSRLKHSLIELGPCSQVCWWPQVAPGGRPPLPILPAPPNNPHPHKLSSRNPAHAVDASVADTGTPSAFWLKISISSKMVLLLFFFFLRVNKLLSGCHLENNFCLMVSRAFPYLCI